jgi:hypothetical protein
LEVGSPRVRIAAQGQLRVAVDGTKHELRKDEELERPVAQSMKIVLPGIAKIDVIPGADTAGLNTELEQSERELHALLGELDVADVTEAIQRNATLNDAKRVVKDHSRIVEQALGDLTRERLEHKLASVKSRVEAAKLALEGSRSAPPTFDAAKERVRDAEASLKSAGTATTNAGSRWEALHTRLTKAKVKAAEGRATMQSAVTDSEIAERRLVGARTETSDAELERERLATAEKAETASGAATAASRDLTAADPEHADDLLMNARAARARLDAELRRTQDEQLEVNSRLRDHGEDGLSERHVARVSELERAAADLRRLQARAAAAQLLRDVLREERDKAHRAYVKPLRDRIESLGRYVFGLTLQVELNDDLQIVSRTLNNRRVPYDSLSGGTREQLGILTRLAVAMAVANDGGVPVIIDDALGYSDPHRLEEMGAALSVAARACQIIVLTCVPDRYRHIGESRVIALT